MPTTLDDSAFDQLSRRHQRELHVHCYRMLASFDEADDAVQETFLRAWRRRDSFQGDDLGPSGPEPAPSRRVGPNVPVVRRGVGDRAGDSFVRAWLYKIATNVCLDVLRKRSRRNTRMESFAELPWISPYPDRLLDEIAAPDEPDAVAVERETIELTFLLALQVLPPRQRAALILRDVMGLPATETADVLESSVASANSALQRARATMQERLPARRSEWSSTQTTAEERELLARFIDAHDRSDPDAMIALAAPDLRITMPPQPYCFDGRDEIYGSLVTSFRLEPEGDWRLVPTRANRMPTAASYLRRHGDTEFRAYKFDVIRVDDQGRIAEITTFGVRYFPAFGLPDILADLRTVD